MAKSKPSKKATATQIRFNWGYHDGAHEAKTRMANRSLKPHFDKTYIRGYERGYYDFLNGDYTGDSTQAWKGGK